MYRNNMPTILFEMKNYNRNIPKDEVIKFHYDCDNKNISGIMLSISTGICNKYNYQIDITEKNNICLYIHDVNYEIDKIKLGVDIIDNLYSKLNINKKNNDNHIQISKDILELINKEYNTFIDKRNTTISHIKESTKKTIQYIEEMELKNLNDLLATKFEFKNTSNLKCSFCNKFIGTNNKSLAVHQRKCKLKYNDKEQKTTDFDHQYIIPDILTSDNTDESILNENDNETDIIKSFNLDDNDNIINNIQSLSNEELNKILSEFNEDNIFNESKHQKQITHNTKSKKTKNTIKN
jgi:Fe-S cluster assembly iron-binding protein IscA